MDNKHFWWKALKSFITEEDQEAFKKSSFILPADQMKLVQEFQKLKNKKNTYKKQIVKKIESLDQESADDFLQQKFKGIK